MEVFNHPTLRLWADPLQFLHHKDYGGVDVVTSHRNQVYLDLYIGESGQFDLHHRKQRSELLVQTQDIQSVLKWVPHPLCPMNPIESLDLQKRISEMKEAKAAHQAESRIYEAAVAIQSKVRQMQVVPKTQAGTILEKTLVQSKQGKYLRSKRSKQGHASPAEPRRVNGHKINDNMPKISAKQRRAKKGVEGSSTKKGVKESSTYFTVGFKPQADTVFSRKTKSGPEQRNDIGSSKVAKEKKRRRGAEHSTSIHRLMVVSKTLNNTFDSKNQHGETSLQSENQHGETKSDPDQSNEPFAAQSENKFYSEQSNDFGISTAEQPATDQISGLGTDGFVTKVLTITEHLQHGALSIQDPLQLTVQSSNSKNRYSTSRGTKNFKEDCIRFGGKEYIAIRENGDKRNQESRGFRGHKPEICDPQYQIRPSSSRAYYARMNRLDENLHGGEASMSATIAYNEANISGSTWMDNERSYVLGDLYG